MGGDEETGGEELDTLTSESKRKDEGKTGEREAGSPGNRMTVDEHMKEYCSYTSIHGVQYLVDRPLGERTFWVTVFIISFVGNSYLVSQVWVKWKNSPVIVTFAERASPVWEIPFPAVTICPMTKYRASDFDMKSIVDEWNENKTARNLTQWVQDLSQICHDLVDIVVENANTTTEEIYENFREKGPDFATMIVKYEWEGKEKNESDAHFAETLTSDGICYSFNGLSRAEILRPDCIMEGFSQDYNGIGWTPEAGFRNSSLRSNGRPLRVLDGGLDDGLNLYFMEFITDFDYWCSGYTPGYKVILHNPASVPSASKKYFILESGQRATVGVEPDVVRTGESLRSYTPQDRQCYFSYERYLQNFKIYTQPNCDLECKANYTLSICGCVSFHMPRSNTSIPICGASMKSCQADVLGTMREAEKELGSEGCDCLPSCTTIRFKLDITQNHFDWTRSPLVKDFNLTEEASTFAISRLSIFFTESQFIASQRSELYGLTDFLANCGGLIGLFSGFSVLSIVEIIYFLTLRGYNNLFAKS